MKYVEFIVILIAFCLVFFVLIVSVYSLTKKIAHKTNKSLRNF